MLLGFKDVILQQRFMTSGAKTKQFPVESAYALVSLEPAKAILVVER